jgi:hypothetical protein
LSASVVAETPVILFAAIDSQTGMDHRPEPGLDHFALCRRSQPAVETPFFLRTSILGLSPVGCAGTPLMGG